MIRLPANSLSPMSNDWLIVPKYLSETSRLLRIIFHKWRVTTTFPKTKYNIRFVFFPLKLVQNFSVINIGACMIKWQEIECVKNLRPASFLRIGKAHIH